MVALPDFDHNRYKMRFKYGYREESLPSFNHCARVRAGLGMGWALNSAAHNPKKWLNMYGPFGLRSEHVSFVGPLCISYTFK